MLRLLGLLLALWLVLTVVGAVVEGLFWLAVLGGALVVASALVGRGRRSPLPRREIGRYGVGMALTTVGDRQLVGHSGGCPGHITLTLVDPVDRLVVSVLTNAVDGPAEELATGLVSLVDVVLAPRAEVPQVPAGAPPLASYTGRFASLWGPVDVAELGGRLVLVRPTAADPLPQVEELEVVDAATLRVAAQPGSGAPGELLPVERDGAGRVTAIRLAGVTSRPVEDFLRRRSALARPAAS